MISVRSSGMSALAALSNVCIHLLPADRACPFPCPFQAAAASLTRCYTCC